ncbi:MAG: plasmid stabilization system protein ParE [Myxococcota bacterium]|jgi:plasmid stabilization system protein ParE
MTPSGYYEDLVRQVITDRRWITAFDVAYSAAGVATKLKALGASGCIAVGASRGTGELPEGQEAIILDVVAKTMMGGIRASEAALDALPAHAIAQIDAFDPDHTARVIRALFSEGADVAGRPTYGRRRPEWVALEDKLIVDALWDDIGIPRAPARIVPTAQAAEAAVSLDEGLGTVWVGDNRDGWHGGAALLRWVRTPADADDARRFLAAHCDRARIMPFLDGIPCSIHGIVFEDAVVALRPCEMLVLRRPGTTQLRYAAAATFWDPRPEDREGLRDIARRVGAHLRQAVNYRGVFTVDGVMTPEGFLPTELNPRFGAAIGVMTNSIPGLPMYLLNLAIVAGEPLDWRPADLEALILDAADTHRAGRSGTLVNHPIETLTRQPLRWDGDRFVHAGDEEPDAQLVLGPAAAGGYLNVTFLPDRTPHGPSAAPRAAAALAYADATFDLGIGPLTPAPDLRPSG